MIISSNYGTIARTRVLSEIIPTFSDFSDLYVTYPFKDELLNNDNLEQIYYLLLANYANSHVASSDENRFTLKLFSYIYQYGPTYLKKIDIQNKLRNLTDDELFKGTKQIYNHAFNPADAPSTDTLDELNFINEQNTNTVKKAKVDAYNQLWSILDDNIVSEFVARFKNLFLIIVEPEEPLLYETDYEED